MKISAKLRYAVRTLCELKDNEGEPVSLSQIEEKQKMSKKYLKQLLQPLEKQGLIGSKRGVKGGYYLKIHPERMRLLDIVEALGESTVEAPCLKEEDCSFVKRSYCNSQQKWRELQLLVADFYQRTKLADFKD